MVTTDPQNVKLHNLSLQKPILVRKARHARYVMIEWHDVIDIESLMAIGPSTVQSSAVGQENVNYISPLT